MMITFTVPEENGKKVLTMDEYISREETIKRIKEVYCAGCNSYNGVRCRACGTGDAIDVIEDAPVADVAPVVRCKGRKHSTLPSELTQRYGVPGTLTCHNRYSPCNRRNVGGDDFCSYGERKDGTDG